MTVCTGNICRSPIAEVVLRERLRAAGLADRVVVDSSGTSDEEHGNPVDPRARRVLAAHGYPTGEGHRAHRVRPDEVAGRDLLLAATSSHARALRRIAERAGADDARVRLLRSFDPAAPRVVAGDAAESRLDIADPWYGDESDFRTTLAEVEAAADGVVEHVRAQLAARDAVRAGGPGA
ncbi:low molecular weight protein-tyrosine-phosphatase [Cellulomonas endophytica]|uniref:low molecular weight protein-tyrosine-phosphatase n=1 Tax=Cellulomonas endophytica TaxID=2494735 RepID=UPI001011EF80|nr:low molecular weight protein-tyrosine-phosphatase [Cellulomonas endophytica]